MFVTLAEAAASVIPIASTINVLVLAVQAAGGGFIALKCLYLGITWRRGHEHGMDEFSALGIAAALIVGATAIGAAVGGSAGMPLVDTQAAHLLNEDLGDMIGAGLYLAALLVPGGRVWQWLTAKEQR